MTDWSQYDFIDLGCSSGGSLTHCTKRFGLPRGVGVDRDPKKIAKTQAAGFEAILADATSLEGEGQVSYVSMMNFLEHLPSLSIVESVIEAASRRARDFLFIRNPSFEGEYLADALGWRQYWWHWTHHPTHPTVADYCEIFNRLGLGPYSIRNVGKVSDTHDPTLVPTSMGLNVSATVAQAVDRGAPTAVPPGLFRRQDIFVALRPFTREEWVALTAAPKADRTLGAY